LAASLGVGDRVRFAGPVQDISTWYAAADLLLLPTVYDPFANVCLEALACGVPVVTSAANGAAEILTEETGVVVEAASDVAGFAAAVDTVLGWGPSRAGACRRMAERYSLERHLRETLSLYEAVRATSQR
jgi:UDP-glucose:(heptosyl)LPS alpha-1,3-glucosyltransferase